MSGSVRDRILNGFVDIGWPKHQATANFERGGSQKALSEAMRAFFEQFVRRYLDFIYKPEAEVEEEQFPINNDTLEAFFYSLENEFKQVALRPVVIMTINRWLAARPKRPNESQYSLTYKVNQKYQNRSVAGRPVTKHTKRRSAALDRKNQRRVKVTVLPHTDSESEDDATIMISSPSSHEGSRTKKKSASSSTKVTPGKSNKHGITQGTKSTGNKSTRKSRESSVTISPAGKRLKRSNTKSSTATSADVVDLISPTPQTVPAPSSDVADTPRYRTRQETRYFRDETARRREVELAAQQLPAGEEFTHITPLQQEDLMQPDDNDDNNNDPSWVPPKAQSAEANSGDSEVDD